MPTSAHWEVTNSPKISVKNAAICVGRCGHRPLQGAPKRLPLGARDAGAKRLRGFERNKFLDILNLAANPLRHLLRKCHSPYRAGRGKGRLFARDIARKNSRPPFGIGKPALRGATGEDAWGRGVVSGLRRPCRCRRWPSRSRVRPSRAAGACRSRSRHACPSGRCGCW